MPDVPPMPTVAKVAIPLDAVAVTVPTTVPPVLTAIVTTVALSEVTVFPFASLMEITGCVTNADPLRAPAAKVGMARAVPLPMPTWVVVAVIDWLTGVRAPLENVSVYPVPPVPVMPAFEKVATPLTAVAVAVPTAVPPALTVIVTTAPLSEVTVFPFASRTVTAGWVVNAEPFVAPAAEVVSASCDAAPVVGTIPCVAGASVPDANVSVYAVPATPEIPAVANVAVPVDAVAVTVPTTVAPLLTVIVTTVVLSAESRALEESLISITGCVVKALPLAAPAADRAMKSFDATCCPAVVTNGDELPAAAGAPLSAAVITCETSATVPGVNVTLAAPDASVVDVALEKTPPVPVSVQVMILPASATAFPFASTSLTDTVMGDPGDDGSGVTVTM